MKYILLLTVIISVVACKSSPHTVYTIGETVVMDNIPVSGILIDITTESTTGYGRYGPFTVTTSNAHVKIDYLDEKMQKQSRIVIVPLDEIHRPATVGATAPEAK